jgi:hypothetical protein
MMLSWIMGSTRTATADLRRPRSSGQFNLWVRYMDALVLAGVTFVLGIATNWTATRRTLALQYDTELRRERLKAYGELWLRLEALNKYGRSSPHLSRSDTEKLVADLKQWYFRVGGIYLSETTRDDYFALQDALQHVLAAFGDDDGGLAATDDAAFEFVRLRASRLRTSLTRDVGTRKTLKLRGEPNRPPLPSELGPVWQDPDHTRITLSRRRSLRLGGWQLGRPVAVRQLSGPSSAKWANMRWDNDAWAIVADRNEDGEIRQRQLRLEPDRLVEGPRGWTATAEDQHVRPVSWTRVSGDKRIGKMAATPDRHSRRS